MTDLRVELKAPSEPFDIEQAMGEIGNWAAQVEQAGAVGDASWHRHATKCLAAEKQRLREHWNHRAPLPLEPSDIECAKLATPAVRAALGEFRISWEMGGLDGHELIRLAYPVVRTILKSAALSIPASSERGYDISEYEYQQVLAARQALLDKLNTIDPAHLSADPSKWPKEPTERPQPSRLALDNDGQDFICLTCGVTIPRTRDNPYPTHTCPAPRVSVSEASLCPRVTG